MTDAVGITSIGTPPEGTATIAIYRKGLVLAFDNSAITADAKGGIHFDYYDGVQGTDFQIAGVSLLATQDPTIHPLTTHSAVIGKKITVQRFGYADVTLAEDNTEADVGEVLGGETDSSYQSNANESALTVAVCDVIAGGTGITQIAASPTGANVHTLFDEVSASLGINLEHAAVNYGVYAAADKEARREVMAALFIMPDWTLTNA